VRGRVDRDGDAVYTREIPPGGEWPKGFQAVGPHPRKKGWRIAYHWPKVLLFLLGSAWFLWSLVYYLSSGGR